MIHACALSLALADLRPLWNAIVVVESGGNASAIGDGGKAVGVGQIHPVMVADVNRVLGFKAYTLDDRLDPQRSFEMFAVFTWHYSFGCSDEVRARRWNGGPRGERVAATARYWLRVAQTMQDLETE